MEATLCIVLPVMVLCESDYGAAPSCGEVALKSLSLAHERDCVPCLCAFFFSQKVKRAYEKGCMMNKYGYMMILLIMALSLLLAGCTEAQPGDDGLTEAPFSETPDNTGPSTETEEQTDHALSVDIWDVPEEDIEESSYWHIADEDGIYLAISPDATVYSFKFVAVHAESAKSGLQYVIDEELYSIEELTPDKPFLVKMQFVGLMPTYGIVFEDQNNHERFYTINAKGTGREESYPYYLNEIE